MRAFLYDMLKSLLIFIQPLNFWVTDSYGKMIWKLYCEIIDTKKSATINVTDYKLKAISEGLMT